MSCQCPTHPACHRRRRRNRRHCSVCIDFCGPFDLDTRGRPRKVVGVTLVNGRAGSLRLE